VISCEYHPGHEHETFATFDFQQMIPKGATKKEALQTISSGSFGFGNEIFVARFAATQILNTNVFLVLV